MTFPTKSFSTRIEAIDILRGFALLGIVIVHMVEQYYAGQYPEEIGKNISPSIADNIAQGFVGIFIIGKFYMIFSFLFGLSFFIQLSKTDSDFGFIVRFSWRLILLFIIGMIHHLHYRGDILTIYAILGFGLLLFHRLPDRALLIVSLLLIFNIPSMIIRGVQIYFPPEGNMFDANQEDLTAYYQAVKSGHYLEILRSNFNEFSSKMQFQLWSGRIFITLGLFLLGIYAGRKQVFENLAPNLPFFKKAIRYSIFGILTSVVVAAIIFGGAHLLTIELPQQVQWLVGGFLFDAFNTALALIYTSWLLVLFQKEKWQKRLMVFYPVGRMGLTTYLMQTLFGTLVFFNYGLGLLGDIGSFYALVLGIFFFIFQIFLARFWFRHFAFGPVEWIWRNLTNLKFQKILLSKINVSQDAEQQLHN